MGRHVLIWRCGSCVCWPRGWASNTRPRIDTIFSNRYHHRAHHPSSLPIQHQFLLMAQQTPYQSYPSQQFNYNEVLTHWTYFGDAPSDTIGSANLPSAVRQPSLQEASKSTDIPVPHGSGSAPSATAPHDSTSRVHRRQQPPNLVQMRRSLIQNERIPSVKQSQMCERRLPKVFSISTNWYLICVPTFGTNSSLTVRFMEFILLD